MSRSRPCTASAAGCGVRRSRTPGRRWACGDRRVREWGGHPGACKLRLQQSGSLFGTDSIHFSNAPVTARRCPCGGGGRRTSFPLCPPPPPPLPPKAWVHWKCGWSVPLETTLPSLLVGDMERLRPEEGQRSARAIQGRSEDRGQASPPQRGLEAPHYWTVASAHHAPRPSRTRPRFSRPVAVQGQPDRNPLA